MKKLIMILPLAIILFVMSGCQDKAAMAELEQFRAQAAVEEQNKEFVKHYFEELNKGKIESIMNETCDPEYLYYTPSTNPNPRSLQKTIEGTKMTFQACPDLNYKIENLYVDGDSVIIWFSTKGTHLGEFLGIPASGNKLYNSGILIWTLKDGKIVEERAEYDSLGLMMQLGMELKPKGEK